jgi:hypothetical protein
MARNLKDFLTEELKRTGYPLQIEIASALEGTYVVDNNSYYFDPDEPKAREIDINAFTRKREFEKKRIGPFAVVDALPIECKKSETHAWIFLTQPTAMKWLQGQCIDFMQIMTGDLWFGFVDMIQDVAGLRLHYDQFKRVANTYVEIRYDKGKESKKTEIFEAKNQLVKFVNYDISQFLERLKNHKFNPMKNHLLWFYHPTIVFDGQLYEAICENQSIRLFERKHILMSTWHSPLYLKDFPRTEKPDLPYLIDVVRKDFFTDFLKILENDYSSLWSCIYDNIEKLKKQVKKDAALFKQ